MFPPAYFSVCVEYIFLHESWAQGVTWLVECLPRVHGSLGPTPSDAKNGNAGAHKQECSHAVQTYAAC